MRLTSESVAVATEMWLLYWSVMVMKIYQSIDSSLPYWSFSLSHCDNYMTKNKIPNTSGLN